MSAVILLTCLLVCLCSTEKRLPSYLKICKEYAPDAGECYVEQANIAIPKFAKGIPELNVPVLDPFHLEEIKITPSAGLQVKFTDANIYGLASTKSTYSKAIISEGLAEMNFFASQLTATANYDMQGQILFLPISGNGKANITLENVTVYDRNEIEIIKKDGMDYLSFKSIKLSYEVMGVKSYLENLFGGNKELGAQMNVFINDHWREYSKDIEPAICEVFGGLIRDILNSVVASIPCKYVLELSDGACQ